MWALRRASASYRVRFCLRESQICSVQSESSAVCLDGRASSILEFSKSYNSVACKKFYHSGQSHHDIGFGGLHCFSSQAGVEESGKEEDDLDDCLSELDTPKIAEEDQESRLDDEVLTSDSEISDDDEVDVDGIKETTSEDLDLLHIVRESRSRKRRSDELFKAIMTASGLSIDSALDKFVKDGKDINSSEIATAMLRLRQRRMFGRALQLSEWLEKTKTVEFDEREYASRVDLVIKVRGITRGENYISSIPESFRGEIVYRTLLANCVTLNNGKKAEEVFNKMRDLEFSLTAFSYNQMLLLYTRTDKKKIADVLLLMEKENVKPTLFTYRLLIDTKGQSNDMNGMEQIVDTMKSEGMEPDMMTLSTMARHYIKGGLKDKALKVLKQMEGDDLKDNRRACAFLLPLYASLGEADEVKRIWEVCESNPWRIECMSAIEAWGRLKNIDEAERVFEKMLQTWKKLSSKQYTSLLKVYAHNKMLTKGKELVKKMGENGCSIGPYTWDALVKLYVDSGEVEKADSILQKATEKKQLKPMMSSYMYILEQYASRGDIHNTEKIFHRMRLAGYTSRIRPFQALAQAYINSKTPAYGMRERLKADNLFPNKPLAAQLAQIDAFKKTAVSDLLD
uniref:PROP1-like PPR domain-containing protein n=1 Tax=Kalanchoe fedtschenkoi TaxID=63787 RepID=A0A7N0TUE3_KALFE